MKDSLDAESSEAVCYIKAWRVVVMTCWGCSPGGKSQTGPEKRAREHWVIFTCVFQRKRGGQLHVKPQDQQMAEISNDWSVRPDRPKLYSRSRSYTYSKPYIIKYIVVYTFSGTRSGVV